MEKENIEVLVQKMEIEFSDLSMLVEETSNKFKEKVLDINKKIEEAHTGRATGGDFEHKDSFKDLPWLTPEVLYEESLRIYGHSSFKHLYNSTFISAYAIFEYYFKRIAEINFGQAKIKHSDLKGQGIEPFKKYIERVVGCDLGSLNELWKRINEFREVRNLLVHDNFEFTKAEYSERLIETETYKRMKSKFPNSLFVDGYSDTTFYISDDKFITEFIKVTTEYLREAIKLLIIKFDIKTFRFGNSNSLY